MVKEIIPTITIEKMDSREEILSHIERVGRTAYKSEGRICPGSAEKFVKKISDLGHDSVIEHSCATVRVICDRGVTHEWVRHRIGSYTQESTRYCNYSKGKFNNEISVIKPVFYGDNGDNIQKRYLIWKKAMESAEKFYLELIESGATPQEARAVLPNSLKTEIVVTMNLRSWKNFFNLRCSQNAHPDIRVLAKMIQHQFSERLPEIFENN